MVQTPPNPGQTRQYVNLDITFTAPPGDGHSYPYLIACDELRNEIGDGADGVFHWQTGSEADKLREQLATLLRGGRLGDENADAAAGPSALNPEELAEQNGVALFNALIATTPATYNYYTMVHNRARGKQPRMGVRLRLHLVQVPALDALPWELLRDPTLGGRYVNVSNWTPVVRYPNVQVPATAITAKAPLRVLIMVARPNDLAALDTEGEYQRIKQSLEPLEQAGLVTIDRVPQETFKALRTKLEGGTWDVFHFIGHGNQGRIYLVDQATGGKFSLSAEILAAALGDVMPRLVILNACRGAQITPDRPFAGMATALIAAGVPAVIAMQYAISDNAANLFAGEFYDGLARLPGWPVDAIMAGIRLGMQGEGVPEWATPVLYLRVDDGVLFSKPREGGDIDVPDSEPKENGGGDVLPQSSFDYTCIPDHITLLGKELGKLNDLLAAAFNGMGLAQLFLVAFNKNLAAEVGDGASKTVIFNMLTTTQAWGKTGVLLRTALELSPNPELHAFAQKLIVKYGWNK